MDALENRFLRDFVYVAEMGSIRRAAEHLGVAASVISRNIADAEQRLNLVLLTRTARGVQLTPAGELVREHAIQRQDETTYLMEQLARLGDGRSQPVRIALGEGFAADLMQNGLDPIRRSQPELRYVIEMAGTGELVRRVSQGEADIAIAYNPSIGDATRSLAVQRQPLCAVVPTGSPLAAKDSVRLAEVLAGPVALLDPRHGIRALVDRAAADLAIALRTEVETTSIALLIRYVTAGLGSTFLPKFAAQAQAERGDLAVVALEDGALQQVSAHLLVRARRRLPGSVRLVATTLAARMQAFAPTAP